MLTFSPRGGLVLSTSTDSQFVHRVNRNGTIDSICRECFRTVACSESESDLTKPEADHVCDPWTRQRYKPRHPDQS